jgi:hypothetical protein
LIEITKKTLDRLVQEGRLEVPDTDALARVLNLMNEAYLLDEFGRGSGDPEVALVTLQTIWLRTMAPPTGGGVVVRLESARRDEG